MESVQVAMIAGLPFTALRDAVLTYPTIAEGLSGQPNASSDVGFAWNKA